MTAPAGEGRRAATKAANRAAIADGSLPPLDVDYCAHAMTAVGLELGQRMVLRDPPDVDGATAFASALFLGGMARAARLPSDDPGA
jgi:hypothetical protein